MILDAALLCDPRIMLTTHDHGIGMNFRLQVEVDPMEVTSNQDAPSPCLAL
jgi:hypothetical protein